jgi:putative redox protein
MPTKEELIRVVKEHIRKRNEADDEQFLFGSERIDLRRINHLKFEASKLNFRFPVDEPAERGGTDEGPNPLAYFIAGAASCLANQYATLAIAREIPLEGIQLTARGHFDRRIGGAFKEIVYDLRLESPASPESVVALSREAERMCYAHNTLKKAGVKMVTNLYLNQKQLAVD